eukprot:778660-Pleurochrysis_carterae.AAC.1
MEEGEDEIRRVDCGSSLERACKSNAAAWMPLAHLELISGRTNSCDKQIPLAYLTEVPCSLCYGRRMSACTDDESVRDGGFS